MERAQRAADSPLRAILEAAKLRRRIEPDAGGGAVDAETAARRAAVARAANGAVPAAPANGTVAAGAAPAPTAAAAAPPAAAAAADAGVTTLRTLPAEALPAGPARSDALVSAPVAPLRTGGSGPGAAELPRPQALALPELQAPRLLHMVEPELTPRLLEAMRRPEVVVDFTIRADGTVADVQVQPPATALLASAIAAAVEQWRFAPLPAPRKHRVELVFKAGGG